MSRCECCACSCSRLPALAAPPLGAGRVHACQAKLPVRWMDLPWVVLQQVLPVLPLAGPHAPCPLPGPPLFFSAVCLGDDVPREEKLPRFPSCLVCKRKAEYYIRWGLLSCRSCLNLAIRYKRASDSERAASRVLHQAGLLAPVALPASCRLRVLHRSLVRQHVLPRPAVVAGCAKPRCRRDPLGFDDQTNPIASLPQGLQLGGSETCAARLHGQQRWRALVSEGFQQAPPPLALRTADSCARAALPLCLLDSVRPTSVEHSPCMHTRYSVAGPTAGEG